MTAYEVGRVGTTPAGELEVDLQILALCIGAAILSLWVARSRVREVRAEMIKLAGAREAAQEQRASSLRELDEIRGQLEEATDERDALRRRLQTPETSE